MRMIGFNGWNGILSRVTGTRLPAMSAVPQRRGRMSRRINERLRVENATGQARQAAFGFGFGARGGRGIIAAAAP